MKRWTPSVACSPREERVLKLTKNRKLYAFLRRRRHELFDAEFQDELSTMYRDTGAGDDPVPPALMCMALLLQGYTRVSDSEAVACAVLDARWQVVLGCVGDDEEPFSQGGLQQFRERLIRHDMDRRLLERTVELAKKTKEFDWKKLPKDLRLAVDSRPFEGAGRVEDTFNLLGHGARKLVQCVSKLTGRPFAQLCEAAGIPVLLATSVKTGLDVDWNNPSEKVTALVKLVGQVDSLADWVEREFADSMEKPLTHHIEALQRIKAQNVDQPEADDAQMHDGVAKDRQVSVEDPEMRHGRKTKSRLFNGFKEHIGVDLDTGLILACSIMPANQAEALGAVPLKEDIDRQGFRIAELHTDLGYLHSPVVAEVLRAGGEIVSKPWPSHGRDGRVGKVDFHLNMRDRTATCPAGQTKEFQLDEVVTFDPQVCDRCPFREQCTTAPLGKGRSLSIAADEPLQQRLQRQLKTKAGRARLRQRTGVEHRLAHMASRQGKRARYRGCRKNTYDARRTASLLNLERINQKVAAAQ